MGSVRPELAIFNALNADPVLTQTNTFGPSLGNAITVLNPRMLRLDSTSSPTAMNQNRPARKSAAALLTLVVATATLAQQVAFDRICMPNASPRTGCPTPATSSIIATVR